MDLRSHNPYSLLRHGIVNSYPSLGEDVNAEIVIIGAGISGSLIAWELSKNGYDVLILDKRHAGTGSTAASTSLLQYEVDVPLHKLAGKVGEKAAARSYILCRDAIYQLKEVCDCLDEPGLFELKPSLQFASFKKHLPQIKKEFIIRKKHGIRLDLLGQWEIEEKYGFSAPGGLLSEDGATADAYMLTHRLLEKSMKKGLRVFDKTHVERIIHGKREVTLITADKKKIKAKKLIIACGYESQQYIRKKVQTLHSTYALASEPLGEEILWYKNSLIWETATPYLYMRTTSDGRILVGGKDIPTDDPDKRDGLLKQKTHALEKAFCRMFPSIRFKTDFSWAGKFASTKDGLPYIGTIPERPHTYFALGYGGNGTTFSIIAADLINKLLSGKKDPDLDLFSFNR